MKSDTYVWADLPHGGLGNKLLVWARANVYARRYELPLLITGWTNRIGIRTFLLGGGLRRYTSDFVHTDRKLERRVGHKKNCPDELLEPEINTAPNGARRVRFWQVPGYESYFGSLHSDRVAIRRELQFVLSPGCREKLRTLPHPCLAVHVRMGDFKVLQPGQNFASVGATRTPLDYFTNVIENIRNLAGSQLPVTVFSDGIDRDLKSLLALPKTTRVPQQSAMTDMWQMSLSKVLVCSAGSTFSYWSGFLGDQPLILHRDHIHDTIRPKDHESFEGGVPEDIADWAPNLRESITARLIV